MPCIFRFFSFSTTTFCQNHQKTFFSKFFFCIIFPQGKQPWSIKKKFPLGPVYLDISVLASPLFGKIFKKRFFRFFVCIVFPQGQTPWALLKILILWAVYLDISFLTPPHFVKFQKTMVSNVLCILMMHFANIIVTLY